MILPDSVTPLGIASARHAEKRKCLSGVIKQTHKGKNGQPGVELGLPVFFKNLPYIGIVIHPLIPSNLLRFSINLVCFMFLVWFCLVGFFYNRYLVSFLSTALLPL